VTSTSARVAWWSIVILLIVGIAVATAIGVWQSGRDVSRPSNPAAQVQQLQGRAEAIVPELLSYTPETIATKADAVDPLLTGDFKSEYRELLENTIVPEAQKQRITTDADVVGAAVGSVTAEDASLLVFVDQKVTKRGDTGPQASQSAVEVGLHKVDGQWLISSFEPV
jgi:Mce-associated membrane protein